LGDVPEDIVLQHNSQQTQSQDNEFLLQYSQSDGHSSASLSHSRGHHAMSHHCSTNDSAKNVQIHNTLDPKQQLPYLHSHKATTVNSNDEKHKIQTFVREHLFPKVKFILCDEDLDYHGRQSW